MLFIREGEKNAIKEKKEREVFFAEVLPERQHKKNFGHHFQL